MITKFKMFETKIGELIYNIENGNIHQFLFDKLEKIVHVFHRDIYIKEDKYGRGIIGYGSFSVNTISDKQIKEIEDLYEKYHIYYDNYDTFRIPEDSYKLLERDMKKEINIKKFNI